MIIFVHFNRYRQNLNQWGTQETSKLIYFPGKSSRGPKTTTHRDSGKQSFPVCSGTLPHICFPLGVSCWLGPILSGQVVYSRSRNSSICLAPGRCQTFPRVERVMDSLPMFITITHNLSFFQYSPHLCTFLRCREMCFPYKSHGRGASTWNPTQVAEFP